MFAYIVPYIGLCIQNEHRSVKRNVIFQIVKTQKLKMAENLGKQRHMTFVEEEDDLLLEKYGKHKHIIIDSKA